MLGIPDGDQSNDFSLPDGEGAKNLAEFVSAWRISTREASLFTYKAGQGPEDFSAPQGAKMPTAEFFSGAGGGTNYVRLAE